MGVHLNAETREGGAADSKAAARESRADNRKIKGLAAGRCAADAALNAVVFGAGSRGRSRSIGGLAGALTMNSGACNGSVRAQLRG